MGSEKLFKVYLYIERGDTVKLWTSLKVVTLALSLLGMFYFLQVRRVSTRDIYSAQAEVGRTWNNLAVSPNLSSAQEYREAVRKKDKAAERYQLYDLAYHLIIYLPAFLSVNLFWQFVVAPFQARKKKGVESSLKG